MAGVRAMEKKATKVDHPAVRRSRQRAAPQAAPGGATEIGAADREAEPSAAIARF